MVRHLITRRGPIDTPRLKLRPDLIISHQSENGIDYYVVKDPVSGRFFRLKEKEYQIASLFDGVRAYDDVAREFGNRSGLNAPVEVIIKFAEKLKSLGFFQDFGDQPSVSAPTLMQRRPLLQKILFLKIKAFNPDRFLEKTLPLARLLYSRAATVIYCLIFLLALITLFSNRLELQSQLLSLNAGVIPLIYLTIIFVTLIHEMSHGYACKLYGGRVSEMGLLLLYLQLYFYTNVSDAYLFPDKKKRIKVTTAGIKSQLIIWALAVLVWRIMAPETIFNLIAFIVIALSFVGIIFNLSPLLKLDGYYYLIDKLGIPNLRPKAFAYWKERLLLLLFKYPSPKQYSIRERRIFRWYGLAAISYSSALFGYILYKLTGFTFEKIGVFGVAILYALVLYLIGEAAKKSGIGDIIMSQRGRILRPRTWMIVSVVLAGIIVLSLIVRVELKISQDCLIYPIESLTITSDQSGLVEVLLDRGSGHASVQQLNLAGQNLNVLSIDPVVREADYVRSGDLLAKIRSTESEADMAESHANLDRAKSQLALLKNGPRPEEIEQTEDLIKQVTMKLKKSKNDLTRSEELAAKEMIPKEQLDGDKTANEVLKSELDFYQKQKRLLKQGARPEELAIAEADIRAIEAKIGRLESQINANNVVSPINGMVIAVKTGNDILTVARIDTMRIRIPVPEKEISPVKIGQVVKFKSRGYSGITFNGIVTKIANQTETGAVQPILVVTANAPNPDGLLKPGMTGHAKIYCGKRPAIDVFLWRVVRWFRVEFWSWY